MREEKIVLPQVNLPFPSYKEDWIIQEEITVSFDEVIVEKNKLNKIKELNISALEIDLSQIDRVWKGKAYANMIDDCWYCMYCIEVSDSRNSIRCSGSSRIDKYEDLLSIKQYKKQRLSSDNIHYLN